MYSRAKEIQRRNPHQGVHVRQNTLRPMQNKTKDPIRVMTMIPMIEKTPIDSPLCRGTVVVICGTK